MPRVAVFCGADLVLPDRVIPAGSLIVEGERIVAIEAGQVDPPPGASRYDVSGGRIVPGFVDLHVHGVEGHDVLDDTHAVSRIASILPRYGVTAFCPTSVACTPAALDTFVRAVASARVDDVPGHAARVLPAHLESNFINPDYKGAQPAACLRLPPPLRAAADRSGESRHRFRAQDVLDVIAAHRSAIGIVTVAPELEGGLALVAMLARAGHLVSIGHSGATYEQARDAIAAGVTHATHLFNRMSALSHRAPGVTGAVLESEHVLAEVICDGVHVHPTLIRLALRMKGRGGLMAITDGTAGSGLPLGSHAQLGDQPITVTERGARLSDGTLAGSVATMDAVFRWLTTDVGLTLVDAAHLCATTPARQMGLDDCGSLRVGARADLVVLTIEGRVRDTFIAGTPWRNTPSPAHV